MPNKYLDIASRMKSATAVCPKCLSGEWEWLDITESTKVICACGWEGDYGELTLFKMRNFPDGLKKEGSRPKRGRKPRKIYRKDDKELIELVHGLSGRDKDEEAGREVRNIVVDSAENNPGEL